MSLYYAVMRGLKMIFFFAVCANTFLVTYDAQEQYTERYYYYKTLIGCYERSNELFVNLDADQICINLFPTNEESCKYIPVGVYIDLDFSNFNFNILRMQVEDFDYLTTRQVCGSCINEQGYNSCLFLQYTNSAKALLHSLTREVELTIGKISIYHADLSNCYSESQSVFYLGQYGSEILLYENGNCLNVISSCGYQSFSSIQLDYYSAGKLLTSTVFSTFVVTEGVENGQEYKRIAITESFADIMQYSIDRVQAYMMLSCGSFGSTVVQAAVTTNILLVESKYCSQLFNDLQLTIYSEKIDLTHSAITSLTNLESYISDCDRFVTRVRTFDLAAEKYLQSVEFTTPTFDLKDDSDKVFKCSYTADQEQCFVIMKQMLASNISGVIALIQVYFYKGDQLKLFVSHYYTELKKSCWTDTSLMFYNNRVCPYMTSNNEANCPFLAEKQVHFLFRFYSPNTNIKHDRTLTMMYSASQPLCLLCADYPDEQYCLKDLPQYFKDKLYLELQITSTGEDQSKQTVFIINTFSSDYTSLFSIIKILAIVIACVLVALIAISIIADLGVCKVARKQHVAVQEIDEI